MLSFKVLLSGSAVFSLAETWTDSGQRLRNVSLTTAPPSSNHYLSYVKCVLCLTYSGGMCIVLPTCNAHPTLYSKVIHSMNDLEESQKQTWVSQANSHQTWPSPSRVVFLFPSV